VFKRFMVLSASALLVAALLPASALAQGDAKPKIGFLPGVVDPFYQVMQKGVEKAAADLGLDVITQVPDSWGPTIQTPILDAMIARGDLKYLITAPTDKEQMVGGLQKAVDAGIKVITVDTFLGDGNYVDGPVTFPLSYIGSDNVQGGRIAAEAVAKACGEKGNVYIQNTNVGASTTEQRSQGFKEGIAKYPNMKIVGEDYNLDDQNTSVTQTNAVLQREKNLCGIFGVNVFSAQGAGQAVENAGLTGQVNVIAFDATTRAIELLKSGVVTLVIAQKPFDMGYLATEFAMADASGVTSLPKHVTTGYAVIDKTNVDDPAYARFIYQTGK
jgi:ribose transport system substrate-binding protein